MGLHTDKAHSARTGPPADAGASGPATVAKKIACWRCGSDLVFNSGRCLRGRLRLHLFCVRCGVPRVTDLHLDAADVRVLGGEAS